MLTEALHERTETIEQAIGAGRFTRAEFDHVTESGEKIDEAFTQLRNHGFLPAVDEHEEPQQPGQANARHATRLHRPQPRRTRSRMSRPRPHTAPGVPSTFRPGTEHTGRGLPPDDIPAPPLPPRGTTSCIADAGRANVIQPRLQEADDSVQRRPVDGT